MAVWTWVEEQLLQTQRKELEDMAAGIVVVVGIRVVVEEVGM